MDNVTPEDIRLARQELWKLGVLSWKLRPEQQKLKDALYEASTQLAVFNISRRWGKTFTLVTYSCEQAIQQKQKIRFGCAFLTDLEEFILPAFEIILEDCPSYLRPTYHKTKKTWYFPNGSEIKLVGLDKSPNSLRGNAISKIIIDEAGFVQNLKRIYTSVIVPATAKQKDIKLIFLSTPPESPEHYFVELINKARTQANGHYVCLTIDDISDMEPAERKRLIDEVGGELSPEAQREFFCKIKVDASRAVAPSFKPEHVQPYDPPHVKWMLFGDTGAKDKTVFLEAGYCHASGKVVFKDELVFDTATPTSEIVRKVKEKWGSSLTLTLDATEQLLVDYSSLGLPAAFPVKPHDGFGANILLLNNHLHNDLVVIHPRCKLLARTLEAGLLNKNRSDFERSDSLGHCDAAAAAIYALRGVDRVTDLRPKPSRENVFSLPTETALNKQLRGLTYLG